MDHPPRDTVRLCMESGCKSELRRNSGFRKPSSVQSGVLGECAGELDSEFAGGSGGPGSPCPSPAVAELAAESSEAQRNPFTSAHFPSVLGESRGDHLNFQVLLALRQKSSALLMEKTQAKRCLLWHSSPVPGKLVQTAQE